MRRATDAIRLITAVLLGAATGLDLHNKIRALVRAEQEQMTDEERVKRAQQAAQQERSTRA